MSESIGTLKEMSYHRQLKYRLMPDPQFHEQRVGKYIADIRCGREIIEIQTCSFYKLREKLAYFLSEGYRVTVAYPVETVKWLLWVDPESGEVTRRKSPKRGNPSDLLREMYGIRELLGHPGLSFLVVTAQTEEARLLKSSGKEPKKRAKRLERVPVQFLGETRYSRPEDFASLIPRGLPEEFTVKDYIACAHIPKRNTRAGHDAVCVIEALGLAERDGNRGRAFLYRRTVPAVTADGS